MLQYLTSEIIFIKNKDGEIRKVISFRKRNKYAKNLTFVGTVLAHEVLRIDLIALRLFGSVLPVEQIIDVNETDVFSLNENERVNYFNPGARI